jgi:hypothetical protein
METRAFQTGLTALAGTLISYHMKNVTITLEEEVLRWAKVTAAQRDTSVSRLLGEELRRKMLKEKEYERGRRRFQVRQPQALKRSEESYPSRDSLHER